MSFLNKIFGDPNKRYLDKIQPLVDKINALEFETQKLSDDQLKAKTLEFKKMIADGEKLEDLLPESFAVCREASRRTTGMRHFDVQLDGGIALHQGRIAEMKTGEGKTLVATLPLYLNALSGKGCHLVTVNDYLARRDTVWMGQIYYALGISTGCINSDASYLYDPTWQKKEAEAHDRERDEMGSFRVFHEYLRPIQRSEAYRADITYGTNNEFGFDYLRDNMAWEKNQMVQRELNYAIVDEVDSILIDEARTPLIISAPAEESTELYRRFASLVPRLKENEDYNVDEKMRAVALTEAGIFKMEKLLGVKNIYEEAGIDYVHHLEQALKAQALFHRERDYVVKNGEVIIVDEFTGRLLPGRRYSEGLHQAIEAKESVEVRKESETLATITFQNYFRLYKKLSGMTGTALTSAEEFANVYKLDVIVAPTNKPMIRHDLNDRIYKTELGKFKAICADVKERHERGQPVLIGTTSIEKNERLSEMLSRVGIPHQLLNAKNHEKEATIIAQAGKLGAVTCATNMAGRGVDIVLGGNPKNEEEAKKIVQLGGLHVIGTERHEARRIDNQLRGRSGRQGDPGSTQFYVSLEDDLMRIFGGDRIKMLMDTLRVPEDQPIENRLISRSLESAQSKVEANNFDLRKHILEYDDVMNKHREVIYKRRREIIEAAEKEKMISENSETGGQSRDKSIKEMVLQMIEDKIEQVVSKHAVGDVSEWNVEEIFETMRTIFPVPQDLHARLDEIKKEAGLALDGVKARTKMIDYLIDMARRAYHEKEKQLGFQIMRQIERAVMLRAIDRLWIDHLDAMSVLREGIGLRGYGQRDPLVEYKREAFSMFQKLLGGIQNQVVYSVYKVTVSMPVKSLITRSGMQTRGAQKEATSGGAGKARKKVGRNDPCPCDAKKADGTPVKYKHCHGRFV